MVKRARKIRGTQKIIILNSLLYNLPFVMFVLQEMPFEAQFALISNTDSMQYGGLASQKVKLWSSAFIHSRSDPLCYLDDYLEVLLPLECRIHGFTGARIVGKGSFVLERKRHRFQVGS